ncbi:uncharacterized protein J4E88_002812 [Alternaria novae-zelandiae]|uniref:uncharacterized protein n=1 Tax=Alternaria novae-zelandiae TaxID=430562 RepID=UPI0020C56681|nr:uncharacterized protein J4E88_002812 [Alternaria novae-zelandiae]KAI4689460.1 hypothetical protein J4E88_002812 [Alternaria novae-zelandiae]
MSSSEWLSERVLPDGSVEPVGLGVQCNFNGELICRPKCIASPIRRERAVEAAITARKSCRALTNKIHASLPLELRNTVYAYIVGPNAQPCELTGKRHVYGSKVRIGKYDSEDWSKWDEKLHVQPKSWAMDPAYFGVQVAQELAEAYYSTNTFYITSDEEMIKLFKADPFQMGTKPYELIRKFTLALNFYETNLESGDELMAMYNNLQSLQLLPTKRNHEICIRLETSFHAWGNKPYPYSMEDRRVMLNILEVLRQPVYDLIHRGKAIRIFQANLDHMKDPSWRQVSDVSVRYLINPKRGRGRWWPRGQLFGMTEEEWRKEKEEASNADPTQHFIFRPRAAEDEQEVDNADNAEDDENDEVIEEALMPYFLGYEFKRHPTLDDETTVKVREAFRTRWNDQDALTGFVYSMDHKHNRDFEGPYGWENRFCNRRRAP